MAGMKVLEREIEKQSEELKNAAQESVSEAQREHDSMIAENYRNLIRTEQENRYQPYAPLNSATVRTYEAPASPLRSPHVPAYQQPELAAAEHHAPAVPTSPDAPSAKARIDDYVRVTVGMDSVKRFADLQEPAKAYDYAAPAPAQPAYDSAYAPAYAPAPERETRRGLFEDVEFKNGEALRHAAAESSAAAPAYAPTYAPAPEYTPEYAPAYSPDEEDEDSLPTRRTMDTVRKAEEMRKEQTRFLSALSAKAKLALVAVTVAVIVLIAVICVNTAILNSLNSDLAAHEEELGRLTETYNGIVGEIDDLTSPENIERWATEHGMTPPEV